MEQEVLRRILEAVFEPHFYNEMMGFQTGRGCHQTLRLLNTYIEKKYTGHVLDADIKSFFNNLNHEWAVKFIESKIKDPNIIRLVRRMLKVGIMEDYQFSATESGSGQGGLCKAEDYAKNVTLFPKIWDSFRFYFA
ncbi:MAG: reverse transcriptase/maturase family protein [Lachnospiraceae bacterium]|nr:reverse transcriptase/maturase family protein [Lachnospiraceae bacterium]